MKANDSDSRIILHVLRTGVRLSLADARILRRASLTLRRWAERECNGEVETDDDGKAFQRGFRGRAYAELIRVPNPEPGALRRIAEVCERNGLHYFHQTDPRGCALYVAAEPLNDCDYSSRGVEIY